MLELLQLEGEGKGRQAEVRPAHLGRGGEADVRAEEGMRRLDVPERDEVGHQPRMLT